MKKVCLVVVVGVAAAVAYRLYRDQPRSDPPPPDEAAFLREHLLSLRELYWTGDDQDKRHCAIIERLDVQDTSEAYRQLYERIKADVDEELGYGA